MEHSKNSVYEELKLDNIVLTECVLGSFAEATNTQQFKSHFFGSNFLLKGARAKKVGFKLLSVGFIETCQPKCGASPYTK